MKTLSLRVDDELNAALEAVCAEQQRSKADVARDALRAYLQTQRLRWALQESGLAELYEELAAEDTALAEEGIADYHRILESADRT
jgi:predicted transcriptional regulator